MGTWCLNCQAAVEIKVPGSSPSLRWSWYSVCNIENLKDTVPIISKFHLYLKESLMPKNTGTNKGTSLGKLQV